MTKRMSYAEIGNSNHYGESLRQAAKPIRPSKFLNDFDSIPLNFNTERLKENVDNYIYPLTARRRPALGNHKNQNSEVSLPILQNYSLHVYNNQPSPSKAKHEIKKTTIMKTEGDQESELKIINKKIKQIINSNKRQVTFQSSLIVIDEQNQIQEIPNQQYMELAKRRKTIVRHKTMNV